MKRKFIKKTENLREKALVRYRELNEFKRNNDNKIECWEKEITTEIEVINENIDLLAEILYETKDKEETHRTMRINSIGFIRLPIIASFKYLLIFQEEIVKNGNRTYMDKYIRLRNLLVETIKRLEGVDKELYEGILDKIPRTRSLLQAMIRDYELDKKLERFGVDFKTTIEYYPKMYEEYKKKKEEKNGGEFEL